MKSRAAGLPFIVASLFACGTSGDDGDTPGLPRITISGRVTVASSVDLAVFSTFCSAAIPDRDDSLLEVCSIFLPDRGLRKTVGCGDPASVLTPLFDSGYSFSTASFLSPTSTVSYSRWRVAMWLTPREDGKPEAPWILALSDWVEGEEKPCGPGYVATCYSGNSSDSDIRLEAEGPSCPP
jgi:hypothetical protein